MVPFFFFLVFLLLRPFSCSSRILSSAIWEESALLRVDISHAYRNSDRYLQSKKQTHMNSQMNQSAPVEGSDCVVPASEESNVFALTSRCSSIHACCTAPVQSHSAGTGSWSSGYDRGSRCRDRLDAAAEAQVSSASCAGLHPPSLPA